MQQWCFRKQITGKAFISSRYDKREMWAAKEARSLGVGKLCNSIDVKGQQQWEAFILLYEMLEEYGTHLVEADWNNQVMT